jgi:hypothetical protein
MNEIDTREGKEDMAGNAAVGATPLALLLISCPVLLFHPSCPCLAGGPSGVVLLQRGQPLVSLVNTLVRPSHCRSFLG